MNRRFSKFGLAVVIHAALLILIVPLLARFSNFNFVVYSATDTFRYFIVAWFTTVVAGEIFELLTLSAHEEGTQVDFQSRFWLPLLTTGIYVGLTTQSHNIFGLFMGPTSVSKVIQTLLFAAIYIIATNALCNVVQVSFERKVEDFSSRVIAYGLSGTLTALAFIAFWNWSASRQPWYSPIYFQDRDVVKYYLISMLGLFFPIMIARALSEHKRNWDSFRTCFSDLLVSSVICVFFTSRTCGTNLNIFGIHSTDNLKALGSFFMAYLFFGVVGLFARFRFDKREELDAASARQNIRQSARSREYEATAN